MVTFRFGHVFLFDTGTSNGNLSGQSRPMSSIDFRPARPYRLVSGSEDNTVALFEGPPFKFMTVSVSVLLNSYHSDQIWFILEMKSIHVRTNTRFQVITAIPRAHTICLLCSI